jgi:Cys-tRNA(Pro) deacylase
LGDAPPDLPASTRRVVDAFAARGVDLEILGSPTSTRTAAEAAASLGTEVAQIVKSLVFVVDRRGVLALVSGINRLDERKLARAVGGEKVARANAEEVRRLTGFVIGGVPPIALNPDLTILCDEDLLRYPIVYAAAGTPHHNFGIEPKRLVQVVGATVADLKLGEG